MKKRPFSKSIWVICKILPIMTNSFLNQYTASTRAFHKVYLKKKRKRTTYKKEILRVGGGSNVKDQNLIEEKEC